MKNIDWKEIARWIVTILSAILAGLGAESCINNSDLLANLVTNF